MIYVLALYPNHSGSRFDVAYYRDRHTPMAQGLLATHGLTGLRLTEGVAALDGAPPAFWMVSEMRFATRDGFERGMAARGAALLGDTPNFTDVTPVLQICAQATELESPDPMEKDADA